MSRSESQGQWKSRLPSERAYKRRVGGVSPTTEQDRAAGGHNRRSVALGEGHFARASISLRLYRSTRRIRAYLRWSHDGKTREQYVCEVEHGSRGKNLTEAWQRAWDMGLLTEEPLPPESSASSLEVRASMRANRGKDTRPELALRKLLHRRGFRYRVDAKPLVEIRRRADLVFPGDQVAVFVDGCFWHGCPEHYRPAVRKAEFWRKKIDGNRTRDIETNKMLIAAGWQVIRVWEHENAELAAERVERHLREVRAGRPRRATAQ